MPSRRKKWGHFARSCWKYTEGQNAHEIAINPQLFESPKDLLETLLHETAHAILFEKTGNAGCTGRYYHRKEFRDQCEELGLECEFWNTRYGWTLTHWPDQGVPPRYRRLIRFLEEELPLGAARPATPQKQRGSNLPAPGRVKMTCACEKGRSILMARGESRRGDVVCGLCGKKFVEESRPGADSASGG